MLARAILLPTFMRSRTFDLRSQEYKRNPYPTLARILAEGPLVKVKYPIFGGLWTATSYEAVNELLRHRETFGRDPRTAGLKKGANLPWWIPRSVRSMATTMINLDEPDHRRLRGLVEQAFLRSSVEQLRPRFETIVAEMMDRLDGEQQRTGQPVDLVGGLARPFPLAVICELLGLPQADRPRFAKHAEAITGSTTLYGFFKLLRYSRRMMDNPERFDIRRQPNPHVAFGAGSHVCLGLKLAVVETEIALRQLFTRFPNLELGIAREQVCWSRSLGTRGLESLPIRLR